MTTRSFTYTPVHQAEIEGIHAFYDWRLGSLKPWLTPHPANPWPDYSREGSAWLRGWKGAADIEYDRLDEIIFDKEGTRVAHRLFLIQEALYR